MELARCGTVFPVSAVVGAAVPAAVCRWGLCPCPGVGRCLSRVNNHNSYAVLVVLGLCSIIVAVRTSIRVYEYYVAGAG